MKKLLFWAGIIVIMPMLMLCKKDESKENNTTTVKDVEGNTYKTVTIGNKVWMAENLKTSKFNNGDLIPTTTSIPGSGVQIYQWPPAGDEANVAVYGRLYSWYTLKDPRGVCPAGYHVPTNAEWIEMEKSLGLVYDSLHPSGQIGTTEGGKLKEAGLDHWKSPNDGATNESGFTALPAGSRGMSVGPIGDYASFWTASNYMGDKAWVHEMNKSFAKIYHYDMTQWLGMSCRCVKD